MGTYITRERLEELKEELETLRTTKRREIAERLKRAKEYGDLSENSEYTEARDEQRVVENRIAELGEVVKNAEVIEDGKRECEKVEVGCTVTVEKRGKAYTYKIVGSNDAKPEEGLISNESPMGKAFLGRREGDKVRVETPGGTITYTITKIG